MPETGHSTTGTQTGDCHTSVGNTALVPTTPTALHRLSASDSSISRSSEEPRDIPPPVTPTASRVDCLNRSYQETGISSQARTLLVAAWRKNTSNAYAAAWRKWDCWCDKQQVNPLSAPLSAVLDFLTEEFQASWQSL